MRIYIAASWKHQHAVEMLAERLTDDGHDVVSFIAEARRTEGNNVVAALDREDWIMSPDGERRFRYDLDGACRSDVVIYLGPSGTDAWAEVGAAYACGVPILGLWAKGESAGLMRRMVSRWFTDYRTLLASLADREHAEL
ncbi:hypothetical protein G3N56_06060 [Desulfovibrio sulfodismutans]|uniref:Nucleoside 2-deoxyribosyltransferase n=1 Tax=Desulfolutivibrio sulfodismutans TaxID=63561 RepID=A0A7K3NJC3_9BACT|nr:hypothetical protein [Desulfolutivibrio sulfodismutans]NDY56306.1 hypothetical protein [Desulfolutivibrio sulfodismutans]QLA11491.1 hypothetical protein GD606_03980 [Desulfolutivibrio sulfodismutans DSM 3696]QLA14209.1 hypothetical protein GD606_19015 [Desulfolutivibrio sulfodismutans DSM 3696]